MDLRNQMPIQGCFTGTSARETTLKDIGQFPTIQPQRVINIHNSWDVLRLFQT